jgi:thiamine-phosphate pyrophosphorylase
MSMNWKRKLLRNSALYVIVDKAVLGKRPLARTVKKVVSCGGIIFQLRDKAAARRAILEDSLVLSRIAAKNRSVFIVNDHPDIAKLSGADGVHLGQDDLPVRLARKLLGREMIIGVSCSNIDQAIKAQREGADYIGIGPIFPTATKPDTKAIGLDLVRQCGMSIKIPFFAIGGIDRDNIEKLRSYGSRQAAICRAVIASADVKKSVRCLSKLLN